MDARYQVRLSPALARAAEAAALAEGIPVSTWIRNQVVAAVYLNGVKQVPQVIADGLRYALQDELAQVRLARVGVDALLLVLPELLTTLIPVEDRRNPQALSEKLKALIDAQVRELLVADPESE